MNPGYKKMALIIVLAIVGEGFMPSRAPGGDKPRPYKTGIFEKWPKR